MTSATLAARNTGGRNNGPRGSRSPPQCPRCHMTDTLTNPAVSVMFCSNCGGMWFVNQQGRATEQSRQYHEDLPDNYVDYANCDFRPIDVQMYLKQHVIGQRKAIEQLSLQIYRHVKRSEMLSALEDRDEDDYDATFTLSESNNIVPVKSNILLLGPSGSGKTLVTSLLAEAARIPYSMSDATGFTQAGYVGDDVESIIAKLLVASDGDVELCERGIVLLDEVDKIAARAGPNGNGRDVGGEGVQQALLKMLEGTEVAVTYKDPTTKKKEERTVNTKNIMFVLSGAFSGIDKIVAKRANARRIGFHAPVDEALSREGTMLDEVDNREVWDVTTADIKTFGMIPEFIGRIPCIIVLHKLNADDLIRIMIEPKNSLIDQFKCLFKWSGCELHVTDCALRAIAEKALVEGTGARGLRTIFERVTLEAGLAAANAVEPIPHITINGNVVRQEIPFICEDSDPTGPIKPKGKKKKAKKPKETKDDMMIMSPTEFAGELKPFAK